MNKNLENETFSFEIGKKIDNEKLDNFIKDSLKNKKFKIGVTLEANTDNKSTYQVLEDMTNKFVDEAKSKGIKFEGIIHIDEL